MDFEVDGVRVHAGTGGRPWDPARPVVVFVHGAACDHSFWALLTRYLAHRGWSVLALDLPGSGQSGGSPPASVGDGAAWLWRAIDTAGAGRVALVGHSLGSLIALEAAAAQPDRVTHLALLGHAVPMAVNDEFLGLAERNDHRAIEMMNDWSHGRRSHLGGCRMPGLWMVGLDTRLNETAGPGVLHAGLKACNDYAEAAGRAAAARVTAPVLVLSGERDLMTPPKLARRFGESFRRVAFVTLPECGHMMPIERPDETLDAVRAFLGQTQAA